MPFEIAGVGEASVADRAAEGSLPGVNVAVDVQLALADKALAAQRTCVGLLPGVPGHVLLQVRLQEEALGATGAAVWTLHGDSVVKRLVEAAGEALVLAGWGHRAVQRQAGQRITGRVDAGSMCTT